MQLILNRDWPARDGSKDRSARAVILSKGVYEVERVPNPYGYDAPWLVLKDTLIGATEASWRQWEDSTDDWQVTIVE